MYGPGFENEGCDGCIGDHYDPSFLYKINTLNYKIESVVKVGSVPKFLTISDNGKLLLVSNWTSSDVSIIDLDSEKEIKRVKVGPHPRGIVINKWNQKAYVAIMGSDKIAVINLLNFSVRYMQNVGKAPRHLILNKSNSHLFVAVNSANKVAKIDLKTWKIQFCDTKSGPRSMTLSASENYLYVVNYYANTFQKIDTKTMSVVETMSTLMKPIGIAGDWKNGNVWVSCYSGKIQIFNDPILRMESEALTEYKEGIEGRIKLAGLLLNMTEFPVKVEPKEPITKAEIETDLQTTAHKHTLQVSKIDDTNNKDEDSCQFTVIVGSFSFLENAYHLQSLLRTQSIPSFLLPSVNGGMTMVAVERTADHNRAVTILKALKHEHDLNAWIFKKNC